VFAFLQGVAQAGFGEFHSAAVIFHALGKAFQPLAGVFKVKSHYIDRFIDIDHVFHFDYPPRFRSYKKRTVYLLLKIRRTDFGEVAG
jgi:hypothetical protein